LPCKAFSKALAKIPYSEGIRASDVTDVRNHRENKKNRKKTKRPAERRPKPSRKQKKKQKKPKILGRPASTGAWPAAILSQVFVFFLFFFVFSMVLASSQLGPLVFFGFSGFLNGFAFNSPTWFGW